MPGDAAKPIDVKMPIKAGLRTIGVTFMRDSAKPVVAMPAVGRGPGGGRHRIRVINVRSGEKVIVKVQTGGKALIKSV